ncbi:Enoyl-CoA hydratase/carnithine racemase [Marinobacter segnicrescens]|uniref:3-hydroxyisobutyryl-CoA hydrolase n=1 Tax=Marinobacter segnicrescens TaxID=430453 RepID=A0A1I0FIW3_9GAMM|nr:enoyl-CoA hydratase/isomerase family protein [Marinobacter segnicrescens]SET57938.1 Enoyl-CoA hydratase/carnithine racemase [Marinobacter segnicrescens]
MSVQTRELPCRGGKLGLLTLDSPATLNALSSDMFLQMQAQLDDWAHDESIRLVMINAKGDRGFSAGGDIREVYQALKEAPDTMTVTRVFAQEYRVDYTLHTFPKPVVTLAHGITMGGGMGLLQASRYRLVTPDIMLAMPEATIGLFPDVGASWFLNRLPGSIGLFMGLTGARMNATDSMRIGLADLVVERSQQDELISRITDQYWTGDLAADDNRLFRLLNQLEEAPAESLPDSELALYEQDIARLCRRDDLSRVAERLLSSPPGNEWWRACIDGLRHACPVSLYLLERQLAHGLQMSLKDIFRMELAMVANCAAGPDLAEGIRARLIDRDNQPAWRYRSLTEVPEDYVESHFTPPWPETEDPLADL